MESGWIVFSSFCFPLGLCTPPRSFGRIGLLGDFFTGDVDEQAIGRGVIVWVRGMSYCAAVLDARRSICARF